MAKQKLKKWLIRKLGGYPELPVRMPDVIKEQVNLVTLRANKTYPAHVIDGFGITSEVMIKDTPVEVEICHRLAWALAPYVCWQMYSCTNGRIEFEANVRVAKGKGDGINIYFKQHNGREYGE